MWQSDFVQPSLVQPPIKFVRHERRLLGLPLLSVSPVFGQRTESPARRLSGTCILRVKLDATALVEVQTMTVRGWQSLASAKGIMRDSRQLVRFTGETVRILVTGEANGVAEIIRRTP